MHHEYTMNHERDAHVCNGVQACMVACKHTHTRVRAYARMLAQHSGGYVGEEVC